MSYSNNKFNIISLSNPLYNTVIAFVSVMALLYIVKPDTIYDRKNEEFRQFGMDDNKTILPIHIIAILLAIILYVLFNQLAKLSNDYAKQSQLNLTSQMSVTGDQRIKHYNQSNSSRHDSEISSLKTQIAMMNSTINQMSQVNQMNQINMRQMTSVLDRIDKNNVQLYDDRQHRNSKFDRASRASRASSSYYSDKSDKRGIYNIVEDPQLYMHKSAYSIPRSSVRSSIRSSAKSNGSSAAKSLDVDYIVDSVLHQNSPANSHMIETKAILPNNLWNINN